MQTLTDDQNQVLLAFRRFYTNNEQFLTINGAAGTGKSTVLKNIIQNDIKYQDTLNLIKPNYKKKEILFAATTNKAVMELSSKLDTNYYDVTTIHSLLGLIPCNLNGFRYTKSLDTIRYRLSNNIVIIDEGSLLDTRICSYILEVAKDKSTKFVFIGDSNQLPPVGQKTISDIFGIQNQVKLNQVVRQTDTLLEVVNSFKDYVETDVLPTFTVDNTNVLHLSKQDFEQMVIDDMSDPNWDNTQSRLVAFDNPTVNKYNSKVKQNITGSTRIQAGEMCVNASYFKPSHNEKAIPTDAMVYVMKVLPQKLYVDGYIYIVNYKFNDYKIWMPSNEENWKEYKKLVDEGKATILKELGDIRPIYASTVHKAQGSTFKRIYIDLNSLKRARHFDYELFKRLLYVAVSRASEQIIFTGDI